jgi:asparagine synthase (glutamine-hydrolysing)
MLWLVDESLRLTDATTMASGVEARVPFLDPRVIAASHDIPASSHATLFKTKALLKQTYLPLLPAHLRTLRKACFFPPMAKWIRREAASVVLDAIEQPRIREYFDVDAIRELYRRHVAREQYAYHMLGMIAQLGAWFDGVYDGGAEGREK